MRYQGKTKDSNDPKVSILCVTYNQEKYIRETLDSFLMQKTDFPFEILVHDDCSTDETKNIISEYAKKHPSIIRPIFEESNQFSQGRVDFVKNMFVQARGQYIAVCEGDDYWTDKRKLQKQVEFMDNNPTCSVVFHPVRMIFEDGKHEATIFPDRKDDFDIKHLIMRHNFAQTSSVMYRKVDYGKFNVNVSPGDIYMLLYSAQSGGIGFIDSVMSTYRRHDKGVWSGVSKDERKIWKRFGPGYIALCYEVIAMYGKKKKYKTTILKSIQEALSKSIEMDAKYSSDIINRALQKQPNIIETLYKYQTDTVAELEDENNTLATTLSVKSAELASLMSTRRSLRLVAGNMKRSLRRQKL